MFNQMAATSPQLGTINARRFCIVVSSDCFTRPIGVPYAPCSLRTKNRITLDVRAIYGLSRDMTAAIFPVVRRYPPISPENAGRPPRLGSQKQERRGGQ